MNEPTFKDVICKFLIKIHYIAIREQKLRQKEALAMQIHHIYLGRCGRNYFD